MLALGIILVVVGIGGGALLTLLASQSSTSVPLVAGPVSVSASPVALVVAGALAAVLVWAGVRLAAAGARHQRSRRRELKDRRQRAAEVGASSTVGGTGAGPSHRPEVTSDPTTKR